MDPKSERELDLGVARRVMARLHLTTIIAGSTRDEMLTLAKCCLELAKEAERWAPVWAAAQEWHDWYGSDDTATVLASSEALWEAIDAALSTAKAGQP